MRTRAQRDGDGWVMHGTKMWITNGPVADVAVVWARTDDGVRGFVATPQTPGFSLHEVITSCRCERPSTSELVLEMPFTTLVTLPGRKVAQGAASCLNEARFGIAFGVLGAARDAGDRDRLRNLPRGVRPPACLTPVDPGEARRHDTGAAERVPAGAAPRPTQR